MTVIATASNPRFWVSRVDIDRDGPTYTIDTLRDLQHGPAGRRALLHHRCRRARRHLHLARCRRAVRPGAVRRVYPPGLRDGRRDARQDPRRSGHDGGGAGAGDQLDRLSADVRCGASRSGTSSPTASSSTSPSTSSTRARLPISRPAPASAPKVVHDCHRTRRHPRPHRCPRRVRQAREAHHGVRRQRPAGDHRRVPAGLGQQRPPGEVDRRRDRGQAARARREAAASRGRARRKMGPDRLRRRRRARAARGGAPVLCPRAALARLSPDQAAGRRHQCADARTLVLLRHGRDRLERRGAGPGARGRPVERGRPRPGRERWPTCSAGSAPVAALVQRPHPGGTDRRAARGG